MRGKRMDKKGAAEKGGGGRGHTRARNTNAPMRSFLIPADPPIKSSRKVFPMHAPRYARRKRLGQVARQRVLMRRLLDV